MNIMSKLTLRHLKKNKRRTLVTIIGVIISVAMLTAVSTLIVSFLDVLQKEAIKNSGKWHVIYQDVTNEQLEKIAKDKETKEFFVQKDIGYAPLKKSQNKQKPFLYVTAFNEQGFENFPIKLLKGRLPQAENEIIISEAIEANANVPYEIGNELTLEIGDRIDEQSGEPLYQDSSLQMVEGELVEKLTHETTKNFQVVGIIERPHWEPSWSPGYNAISYIDEQKLGVEDTVHAAVVVKNIKRSLFEHAEQFAKKNNIEAVGFNNELLRYYGVIKDDVLRTTLYSFSAIIMAIIVIGSVSLIYNAFAISVSERSRHLGMLSSVGATKKQKRNSVFFEGAVIGMISIPIGIISGITGIGITFYFINPILQDALGTNTQLQLVVTSWSLIVACLVSILTIFISTYLPAKRASKITAIDAIRQTEDIKLTNKAVKTSKLVRKVFGIEAEIGLKNLKRNKRKYMATVFSLVISIILFLSVTYFTDSLKKSNNLAQDGINFDIQIAQGGQTSEQWDRLTHSVQSIDEINEMSQTSQLQLKSWVDETTIADELDVHPNDFKNGKFPYNISIYGLDDANFTKYAKDIGVDLKKVTATSGKLPAIVIDTVTYRDEDAGKRVETKAIHTEIGRAIDLVYEDWENEKEIDFGQLEVAALTDQEPLGVFPSVMGTVNIIVSEQVMDQFIKKIDPNVLEKMVDEYENYLFIKSADPIATQDKIEKMKEVEILIHNFYQARQQEEQMILLISVFTYGFIALITAISIANIFNTISTSISLRKREFAMLKSVGMTPKGFNKMINYESIFYGIKALLYGLPLSIGAMYFMHQALSNNFVYKFELPWMSIVYVVIGIFLIVSTAMLYSSSKVKKENIIDALKQENI